MLLLELIDPTVDGNASAYTPVVFKRHNDAVTAVNVDGENVTVKKTSGSYTKTTAEGWTLVGVMEQTVFNVTDEAFAGKDIYYISNNKFWHATGKLTNNPFRAYIEHAASGSEPAVKALGIGVANSDDITAVDGIPGRGGVHRPWCPGGGGAARHGRDGACLEWCPRGTEVRKGWCQSPHPTSCRYLCGQRREGDYLDFEIN